MRAATASVSVSPVAPARIPLPLAILAFCLLWSSAFAAAKLAIADCPPLILLALRFLAAGVLMLGAAAIAGVSWSLSRRDVAVFALLGVANQAVYLGLGYVGMRYMSSGLAALIISTNPILTAILAALFLDERMTWRNVSGLLIGLAGVAFIVQNRLSGGADHLAGILFSIAALISLVVGTILFKRLAPKGGLWIGNGVQSLAAGIAILPFAATFESTADIVPSWRLLATFAYLVLLVSIFGYLLWFHILSVSGATAASSYHFLMPPLGMLFGWLLIGEHVALTDLIGIVPVALGIYLVTRAPVSPRKA
jgi:drug/metabolite transporter (DMT)-like permease